LREAIKEYNNSKLEEKHRTGYAKYPVIENEF